LDVVAHGLWGGAPFYAQGRKCFFTGVVLGMAPDNLSQMTESTTEEFFPIDMSEEAKTWLRKSR
jgi:hypothetical protein